ncbi:hypothetical protein LTR78_010788 [Recurvomyces mirabilis]|uniref:DUF7587 domain-containing protein n=2 Tax=Recurvomyces mirabilis TaxID=574656 RepID=A0AAE0TP46_9PEZI|nr:hypothetical protein LTR78_010788 [Recurvomyces mirabilis]
MIETPFVSTSNLLVWILRLALNEAKEGRRDGQITVINGSRLERKHVYHALPMHRELCEKRAFEKGAWKYPGSHKFMVYHKILAKAIVHTVGLEDMVKLAKKVAAVGHALNFQLLAGKKDFRTKVRPQLESARVELLPAVINAMARFLKLLGLTPASTMEQISYLAADIVQGWAFRIEAHTPPEEYQQMSAIFAYVFCKGSFPDLREHMKVRMAFLDGLRWGLGTFSVRHSVEALALMQRKANMAGLAHPAKILSDELDAARLHITMFGRKQQALITDGGRPGNDMNLIDAPGYKSSDDADEEVVYGP